MSLGVYAVFQSIWCIRKKLEMFSTRARLKFYQAILIMIAHIELCLNFHPILSASS